MPRLRTPPRAARRRQKAAELAGALGGPVTIHPTDANLAPFEQRFRRAGLPLFIEDYSATEDIFNRSVPLLGLVFLGEVSLSFEKDWSLVANVSAVAGGLVNRVRRRPFTTRPERFGRAELIAFVVVPAFPPLVFGLQVRQAILAVVANLWVLGLVYLIAPSRS